MSYLRDRPRLRIDRSVAGQLTNGVLNIIFEFFLVQLTVQLARSRTSRIYERGY